MAHLEAKLIQMDTAQAEIRHGENMPIPYRLSLKSNEEAIRLFKMKSGKFHVFKYGTSAIYLVGSDFIVAKDPLVGFLKRHSESSISIKSIEVIQAVTHETWDGYWELIPSDYLVVDVSGHRVDLRGIEEEKLQRDWVWKLWGVGLFLSPSLCEKLRKEDWANEFELYPGLAGLAR
jgi:hypothetical protein